MLTCREVAERADSLLEGELTRWERMKVRLHLLMCRGCSNFVRQMRTTREMTRRAAAVESSGEPTAEDRARMRTILSALRDD